MMATMPSRKARYRDGNDSAHSTQEKIMNTAKYLKLAVIAIAITAAGSAMADDKRSRDGAGQQREQSRESRANSDDRDESRRGDETRRHKRDNKHDSGYGRGYESRHGDDDRRDGGRDGERKRDGENRGR